MTESAQPLFYKKPIPLQKEKHASAGLDKKENYKFAKKTNSVPIILPEFAFASKFYPIVFTNDSATMPVVVLGLKGAANTFVNLKGEWEKNFYIPAYVRRYPFAFTGNEDQLILCIDESAERFKKEANTQSFKFFDKDKPAEVTQQALRFCSEYHRDQKATALFTKVIKEKGLLVERQVNVTAKEPISLKGFSIVDEEKLKQLDENTLLEWNKNGYLGLIYATLLSYTNWSLLASRV